MLSPTRMVVVDNDEKDLNTLVTGLNQAGYSCRGIQYLAGPTEDIRHLPCPHVRVIFMDIDLAGTSLTDEATDEELSQPFSNITGLLERIAPEGPYILVLWTIHEKLANRLQAYLQKRLSKVPEPFDTVTLPKTDFTGLAHNIRMEELPKGINSLFANYPVLNALSDWEEKTLASASRTVAAVTMVQKENRTSSRQREQIPILLARIAQDAAGRPDIKDNPFRAINEALVPVLSDQVTNEAANQSINDVWNTVFAEISPPPGIPWEQASRLNRAIHIDMAYRATAVEPGSVIAGDSNPLASSISHLKSGLTNDTAHRYFWCKKPAADKVDYRWILVQTQAPCDYAQSRHDSPAFIPFYLGILCNADDIRPDTRPQALWVSPPFTQDEQPVCLAVNARFPVSLSLETALAIEPLFRIRTQLLVELLHRMHAHGSRPGIITITGTSE